MILLSVHDLIRQFADAPILRNVSFEVRPREKIGLIGPNGAGKTTLLKILAKLDEPDSGDVEYHPTADVALLEQESRFPDDQTLLDLARSGLEHLYRLQEESHRLAEQIAAESNASQRERHQRQFDNTQQELRRLNAFNVDHRVEEVLEGLSFTPDEYLRPIRQFSGGQQNRALLARLLLRAPHLMLLDEPTNHLDIAATEWLEQYLAACDSALIVVSHDRFFLDRVTTRTWELNDATLTDYTGNFSAYWTQRAERRKVLERTHERQQEFIARTEDFIRRNKSGQKHAQAADREKKLERLERVEPASEISPPPMAFCQAARTGDWVIQAEGLAKGYARPLFRDVSLTIERGQRVGILGPNGCGKTTLLRMLLGDLTPDAGTVRLGTGVKVGYLDQQLAIIDVEKQAIDAVRPDDNPTLAPQTLRSVLARFGIRGEKAFQKVGDMSGGEKSKVALARLAVMNANLLVLDEPTNHLDLWARAALEEALGAFEGTVLFVSHDRYFIDRLADRVIVLEPDRWREFAGNYSRFKEFVAAQEADAAARKSRTPSAKAPARGGPVNESASPVPDGKPLRRKRRFPYRKLDDLEADIHAQETRLHELQAALSNPDIHRDGQRAKQTLEAFKETRASLAQLYEHWEEAMELN